MTPALLTNIATRRLVQSTHLKLVFASAPARADASCHPDQQLDAPASPAVQYGEQGALAEYVLAYAAAGFTPVLLQAGEKVPAFKGWKTMPTAATLDILNCGAAYNLGVAPQPGYFFLDVDVKNGARGLETLNEWEAKYGPLPATLVQRTASGGFHYYFKLPEGVQLKNLVNVAAGIDIRTAGAFVAAEPSTVDDGKPYGWLDWDPLSETRPEIADAPAWLVDLLGASRDHNEGNGGSTGDRGNGVEVIREGHRNDLLFRRACGMRRQGFDEQEITAALQSMNARQCVPPLQPREVAMIAKSVAKYQSSAIPGLTSSAPAPRREFNLAARTAARLFVGDPKPVAWLVERIFPLGKVIILASPPGIGKSNVILNLGLQVAMPQTDSLLDRTRFALGGRVVPRGHVVIISAEDDEEELHRRLHSMLDGEPMPEQLHIVSLPDQGHFYVAHGDQRTGVKPTPEWEALKEEILQLGDVALTVVDTLQAVSAGDLNAAEVAQAMMNELTEVANQTGAAVIVLHHLVKWSTKDKGNLLSAQEAMDTIRGSGAIVGSARAAYCLFPHPKGKDVCGMMGIEYEENKVVYGLVAKANGPARRDHTIYIRNENGLLVDRTYEARDGMKGNASLLSNELCDAITKAYQDDHPFAVSTSSVSGLRRRRAELPDQFHGLSADALAELAESLVKAGRVQKIRVKNGHQYVPRVPVEAAQGANDGSKTEELSPPPWKGKRTTKPRKRAGAA